MALTLPVAAVVAVLSGASVTFVDTGKPTVVGEVRLPGQGAALFAAPDGRVVVPLRAAEESVVVSATGKLELWRGRIFPLFFDEFDRMHVLLPGELVTMSYPERVPILRVPVAGAVGAWRLACSLDGRVVAFVPGDRRGEVVLITPRQSGPAQRLQAAADVVALAVARDGSYVAAAEVDGSLEAIEAALGRGVRASLGGRPVAVEITEDGRTILAAVNSGGEGWLAALRLRSGGRPPKERFRTPLGGEAVAMAATGEEVVVALKGFVALLGGSGRTLRHRLAISGTTAVAFLPAHSASAVPDWGEGPPD